ncbi:MAG TPA: hypothetical protein VGE50_13730 [Gammaproteobacteria bacterium]
MSTRGTPLVVLAMLLLAGCPPASAVPMRGFNFLQAAAVTLDHPTAGESLRRMQQVGANSVVLVPFFHQHRAASGEIGFSDAVTDRQLSAAISEARRLHLKVVLKPQVLVENGWAGDIRFAGDADEQRWFGRYRDLLLHYAHIAQREKVDAFVIGTELAGVESSRRWYEVIASVRKVYHGRITYAAHGVKGVLRFPAWQSLDAVAVSLYPSLGDSSEPAAMRGQMEKTLTELRRASRGLARPLWVMEVGIPSAQGALRSPWDWRRLRNGDASPDPTTQGVALGQWLDALDKPWINAVFLWCWSSDPHAGGMDDNDYTPQNKPAERQVRCAWLGECEGSLR